MPAGQPYSVISRGIGGVDYAAPKPVGQVPVGPVYTSTDIAELAARLGSIVTFDRRGNVIWFDDFESGIAKWTQDIVHVGGSIEWSADRARNGAYSAKLVTAPAPDSQVGIIVQMAYPVLSRLGYEFSFNVDQYTQEIAFDTSLYDGTWRHRSTIEWREADKKFYFYDDTGYHALEPAVDILQGLLLFHTVKMVIDYNAEKYVRLVFDNITYDLSGKAYAKSASAFGPELDVATYIMCRDTGATTAYTDDVIVTQNEPANPGG